METIGFIGLGRMGGPMAANLARKGFDVTGLDVAPKALDRLAEAGGKRGASLAEVVAAASIVVTMLPAGPEVLEVVLGTNGVAAHAKPGTLVMDMSTIDPEATDKVHDALLAKGLAFVDAPVGRVAWHAERGQSLFMVGGTPENVARVRPLLDAMGTTVLHCGPAGAGTRMKLVNNYLAIILCQLNAEALTLSQRFGLELETTLEVLHGTTATNGQLKINWPDKVLAGDTEPGFTIDLAHKDLSLILAAANASRVPLPVAAAAREAFSTARARGYGGQDFSAMVDVLCDIAQVERARLKKG